MLLPNLVRTNLFKHLLRSHQRDATTALVAFMQGFVYPACHVLSIEQYENSLATKDLLHEEAIMQFVQQLHYNCSRSERLKAGTFSIYKSNLVDAHKIRLADTLFS
jgi:hypothetical protein